MQCTRNFTKNYNFLRSVWRSASIILNRHPCEIQHLQEIKSIVFIIRQDFETGFSYKRKMLQTGLCVDNAHFSLCGSVKTKNCHIRTKENLHGLVEKSLHDLKLTLWCSFKASSATEIFFL